MWRSFSMRLAHSCLRVVRLDVRRELGNPFSAGSTGQGDGATATMNMCGSVAVLCLVLAATFVSAQFPNRKPDEKVPEVGQRCMDCICQASSNCDETIKCHNGAGGGYFCGPYVISWAYWHDGGRPGDKGKAHDFETCLTNRTCAEEAVRGYMRKYGQDCDGSGQVDCFDFARIHKLGFGQCSGNAILSGDYWEKFEICYDAQGDGYRPPLEPSAEEYDYGDAHLQARNIGYNN